MFSLRMFVLCAVALGYCVNVAAQPAPNQSANEAAALAEMNTLANAEEICAGIQNFYVSLETLNDVVPIGVSGSFDNVNLNGGSFALRLHSGFFDATRTFFDGTPQWEGNYVNYQQNKIQVLPDPYDLGSPLDPWFTPYYFFSPHGLVRGDNGAITQELYGNDFDRFAIVSLGADGVMSNDDLIFLFGGGVTSLGLSTVSGASVLMDHSKLGTKFAAAEGALIELEGYVFGATQGASQAFFGATELTDITSWSATSVTLNLPAGLTGTAPIFLRVGGNDSNALSLTIHGAPVNGVGDWRVYE
jgi:hypothetical protein